jgi:endonuclease/exonuclease/phosphatase (EEP) superfamily protein YafD
MIAIWVINDVRLIGKSSNAESDFSVLYWNVARGKENSVKLISERIESLNPDIIGLVEAENIDVTSFIKYQAQPYNYTFKKIGSDLLVGTKREIIKITNFDSDHFFKYGEIKVKINSKTYNLYIVDIFANQPYFRKRILDSLYKNIDLENNNIILGDFNTPYESIHLEIFKQSFWNAEREAGSGFIASWPDKYHLLQIDHIWSSKSIVPVFSSNESTDISDHSMLFTKFKMTNPPKK